MLSRIKTESAAPIPMLGIRPAKAPPPPKHGFCQVVVRVQIATGQRFCGSKAFGLPPVGSFAVPLKWYYHHARRSKAPVGEFSTRTMVSALMSQQNTAEQLLGPSHQLAVKASSRGKKPNQLAHSAKISAGFSQIKRKAGRHIDSKSHKF